MTLNQEDEMRSDGTQQPQSTAPVLDSSAPDPPTDEAALDGDFIIEGDGGTVDSGGQAQVPPRPPI